MYIAIAGNIGSGKTTLTEILTKRYGAKAYYENLANPYISDFYEDMGRWSFHLQLWFLGSRIQQTLEMLADGSENIVQDRTIYEDAHIFANNLHAMGLMASRDFDTYMKMFNIEQDLLPKPDVLIYLKASVPTLISQIKMRGREYERISTRSIYAALTTSTITGLRTFMRDVYLLLIRIPMISLPILRLSSVYVPRLRRCVAVNVNYNL